MIVSLDELKRVLGIELDNTDEDDNLTRLILAATAWVQGKTHRRFDSPILRTEYRNGTGRRELYLSGHVDDSVAADNPSETLDPTTSLHVYRRPIYEPNHGWEELIEGEDWERRGDMIVFLRLWAVWPTEDEVRLVYLDGYVNAPEDLKAVILELAMNQYNADVGSASGTTGVTSESLGDFSWDAKTSSSSASGGSTTLTATSLDTLNHYRRTFV